MSIDRIVFAVAGFFITLSLALGMSISPLFQHEYWLFFTAFVGLNLFQSAFTGFCPLAMILKLFGAKPGQAFK
jgi:NO-binding membrane sensor protein with MHYT domain